MIRALALLGVCLALPGCASIPIAAGVLTLGAAGVNVINTTANIIACKRHDESGCAAPMPVLAICDDKMTAPCLFVGKSKP